jgi:ABC-type transport system substrate-binding protein
MKGSTSTRGARAIAIAVVAAAISAVTTTAATASIDHRTPQAKTSYDPKGVLRWATDLSGAGRPVFDPASMTVADSGTVLGQLLYDSLLRTQPDGSLQPELAKSAEIVDPQTITVVLRDGLKFQDGSPLDAEALKFTILRNRDSNSVAFSPPIKDVASIDVVNPTTLTIHLSKPTAGAFYPLLASLPTMPVSPTAVAKGDANPITNPLGAGPFRVKELVPEQRMVLEKSPSYWNAKTIKLGGIEYVQAPAGPPAITALRGGTVDVIGSDLSQLGALSGGGVKTAVASSATSLLWFPLCKSKKPLDDVRVRQALNYALDREAINASLAEGRGKPAWSLVPPESSRYDATLNEHYAHNVKKARSLLKEAGYANGVDLTLMASPGIAGPLSEAAQQQWKEAGLNVEIVPTSNIVQDLFIDNKAHIGAATVVRGGLDALQTIYTPGNLGDLCGYSDPTLTGMIDQLRSLDPADPKATKLWNDAQEFVINNALAVYGVWLPAVVAYNSDRVGGVEIVFPGVTGYPNFFNAYVKK